MADKNLRLIQNIPGPFYVDETCIDCDLCRTTTPAFFRRNDEIGLSTVYRQPVTSEEVALAEEARDSCPTESIGNDGSSES
jgi:ferredoxin